MYHKRREQCVLFLEDVFGATDHPEALRKAGFYVECFRAHFSREGKPLKSVADPQIIKFCAENKYVLFTLDKRMKDMHLETIRLTDVAIVATSSNRCGLSPWINAIIKAKRRIERHVRKTGRPWFAVLSRNGDLRVQTISASPGSVRIEISVGTPKASQR